MPLYHGTAINAAQLCLLNGITFCVGTKFSGTRFWSDIRDSKATAFVYVGEMCRYLIAQPPSPLDKQHHVTMIFGNGLRPDIWERLKARFGIEYINEFFNSTEGVFGTINVCRGVCFQRVNASHYSMADHICVQVLSSALQSAIMVASSASSSATPTCRWRSTTKRMTLPATQRLASQSESPTRRAARFLLQCLTALPLPGTLLLSSYRTCPPSKR